LTEDIESGPLQVKGLRRTAENLQRLAGKVQLTIAREASRAAMRVIARAAAAATYTTFERETGATKSGFGTRVAALRGTTMVSYVVQYPQNISGSSPMAVAYRQHHLASARNKRARKVDLQHVAFWWRFLEFGTKPHAQVRKPNWLGKRTARNKREAAGAVRFMSAAIVPGIAARPWVRPAFNATGSAAVTTFERELRQGTESEINNLPK
jgi:HK97 gp10 family phage protein